MAKVYKKRNPLAKQGNLSGLKNNKLFLCSETKTTDLSKGTPALYLIIKGCIVYFCMSL